MAINPLYIPLFTLEEVFLDKSTGLPLAAGVVTFYRDAQRATPKSVYQIQGTYPNYTFADVGNEFVLGLNGTFVDEDGDPFVPYALPYDADGAEDLYFVRVVSEGLVAQFTREAVPHIFEGSIDPAERTSNENEISNSQFVEVNFPTGGAVTLSVTGSNTVTSIAPDWDLITSGTGTVVVERLEPTASNVDTNPPYALRIEASSALGATVTLRQRLTNTPSIFRGKYVSGTLTAAVVSGGGSAISMSYAPSTGTATTIISNTNIPTDGDYHPISGNALITEQVNTAASSGYVDINIVIPTARNLIITSIQIAGSATSVNLPFNEQTVPRQKDHLFHYYEDATVRQAKANLLAGWTFGLNPWQFRTTASSNVSANQYTADQTIIIQQRYVASAAGNNVAVRRATAANNYAFQITAVTTACKVAVLQYIAPQTIRPYWGEKLSVRLKGWMNINAPHNTSATFKVRLIYRAGLPLQVSQTNPVSSWADVGNDIPTLTGWTYLTATNDPTYTLTSTSQNFNFDGFQLPASSSDDMTLGVMFIMMENMDPSGTADNLFLDRISLVRNDFAIDADPETWDESFRKCQFYFQKTFDVGVVPADNTGLIAGALSYRVSTAGVNNGGALWRFSSVMRAAPTGGAAPLPIITSYNPLGGGGNWVNQTLSATSGTATPGAISQESANITNSQVGGDLATNFMCVHLTADARLGR